jgi:hypothetical protein
MSIFASYLKAKFERFFSHGQAGEGRDENVDEGSRFQSRDDRDYSLREYELYYWGSVPGPWY